MDPGKDGGSEAPYKNDRATIRDLLYVHSLCQVANTHRIPSIILIFKNI